MAGMVYNRPVSNENNEKKRFLGASYDDRMTDFFRDAGDIVTARDLAHYDKELRINEHWTLSPGDVWRHKLAGKRILLVGGGKGDMPAEFSKLGIHPRLLTNIDNYVAAPSTYDRKEWCEYIKADYLKTHFKPDSYDEIWALYSLPCYCRTTADVRAFFAKSMTELKPGGALRVLPIDKRLGFDLYVEGAENAAGADYYNIFESFADRISKDFSVDADFIRRGEKGFKSRAILRAPSSTAAKSSLNDFCSSELLKLSHDETSPASHAQKLPLDNISPAASKLTLDNISIM